MFFLFGHFSLPMQNIPPGPLTQMDSRDFGRILKGKLHCLTLLQVIHVQLTMVHKYVHQGVKCSPIAGIHRQEAKPYQQVEPLLDASTLQQLWIFCHVCHIHPRF
jgi:hypothetical protein